MAGRRRVYFELSTARKVIAMTQRNRQYYRGARITERKTDDGGYHVYFDKHPHLSDIFETYTAAFSYVDSLYDAGILVYQGSGCPRLPKKARDRLCAALHEGSLTGELTVREEARRLDVTERSVQRWLAQWRKEQGIVLKRKVTKQSSKRSAEPGVCWDSRMNRWSAQVYRDGEQRSLGRFRTEEAAIRARRAAVACKEK